ncbi:MAG: hypothetical protein RIR00_601 [Pseudomonadota bacterium]|jgi:hypothetical protein
MFPATLLAHDGHAPAAAERPPARGATPAWTEQSLILPAGRPEANGATPYAIKGMAAAQVHLLSPDLRQPPVELAVSGGRWRVAAPDPKVGGYHWIVARSETPEEIHVATTALSFPFPGPSPEARLGQYRPGLEILPRRLPERGGFREGDTRSFQLRFDGLPLAGIPVALETENGSRLEAVTDRSGDAAFRFPHDFSTESIDPALGVTRSRKAYVVSSHLEKEGLRHVATFNQFYHPDLMRERSLPWGAGFTLLGMALAVPLLRRKDKKNG